MANKLAEIKRHSELYVNGVPEISDAAYDALVRKYNKLNGNVALVTSPIVGSAVGIRSKVTHNVSMLSLNNAFDETQRVNGSAAMNRRIGVSFIEKVGELKIDGNAAKIDFLDGELVGASTRGNGKIGENILPNAQYIGGIPTSLNVKVPGILSIVGEVYINNSHFKKLNEKRVARGDAPYATPRNTVAGGVRNSNAVSVKERGLRFFAYGLLYAENDTGLKTHSETMAWLSELGLPVVEHSIKNIVSDADVELAFSKLYKKMDKLDYDCDGVVIKADDYSIQERLGSGSTAPHWAFACKLGSPSERTTLKSVSFNVGRTGSITPVGVVEEVVIGDVKVKNVTLHNLDFIEGMDLHIGDSVLVERAGEVIPAIVEVYASERSGKEKPIKFPKKCPSCSSKVFKNDGEAKTYCSNSACSGQLQRRVEHFCGQNYMNIMGVGTKQIAQLIENGYVKEIPDLYTLKIAQLLSLDGFQRRKAEKLLSAMEGSKIQPLSRVLASLGIREIGRSASVDLAQKYGSMKSIIKAKASDVEQIDGFGTKMAESLVEYFAVANNRRQINRLEELGVNMTEVVQDEVVVSSTLSNLNICFTGKLENYTRKEIADRITQLGGKVQSSVTKSTDILLAGAKSGSKLKKAESMGVRIISEMEFNRMVK